MVKLAIYLLSDCRFSKHGGYNNSGSQTLFRPLFHTTGSHYTLPISSAPVISQMGTGTQCEDISAA